jgi:phosphatidylserine/phosphatidylglycerophosphate/cardiolipin synthase-like enzyme
MPSERLILHPHERRQAIREVIHSARRQLMLSIFRCDDFSVLDALAAAVERKVHIRALLTPHAKNWEKKLTELESFLESMGVEIQRYPGAEAKYHAKYIVADEGASLVASLNFTRKCFDETCDFILVSQEKEIASSLTRLFEADWNAAPLPASLSDRLILGPENARQRFLSLLQGARQSIRIIDHRLSDPQIMTVLRQQQDAGVSVQVLGHGALEGAVSHGRLLIVDEAVAVTGSMALSQVSLDKRREVAVVLRDPAGVFRLKAHFDGFARKVPPEMLVLSEFVGAADGDDDLD